MTATETGVPRRHILAAVTVVLAGCSSEETDVDAGETAPPTSTDAPTPTGTPPPDPGGWSVRFAHDGDWQGSVSVTTTEGDSHQAFDDEGDKTIDIESQLGVETRDVRDIVVTAQKMVGDDETLSVTIRKDGDVVAEGSTDEPGGQVMISHHDGSGGDAETPRPTETPTATETPTPTDGATPTDTPPPDSDGWSVRFAYDGDWQGSVSVTTAEGDSHQAFDGEGTKTVDVEAQLGIETRDVRDIVVMAQKMVGDDETLSVTIRKDGDVVAEGSTDEPGGQVMVSHHVS